MFSFLPGISIRGTDPPCPTSYGFVLFASGDEGFEPIGQLDEPELARVLRAVKGIAHPHLSQLGGCVDIAEQAVEQVEEALQVVVGIACRIAAKSFEQPLALSGSQLPVLFHSVVVDPGQSGERPQAWLCHDGRYRRVLRYQA